MRIKLHGSPGTPAGRRRGGINSIISHKNHPGNFKLLKSFKKPKDSSKLAELLGILIGDGHLSNYQVLITTNSETDMDHALFVKNLIQGLFGLSVHVRTRKNEKTVNLVVSSKGLVEFLNTKGMPIGNKIKKGIGVPSWIKSKLAYKRSFLKGLFDTDGCVYIDSHKTKNRIYRHFGWTITSYADTLLEEITGVLGELGFTPTQRASQKSVFLRKQGEIKKYFESIGTHNPKHYKRFWRSTEVVITGRSRKPL
jgi:intein/homing endonuclease